MPAALALCASVLWGFADFLGGTLTRRLRALTVVGVSQGFALLGLLGALVVVRAPLTGAAAAWGAMAGLVGLLALGSFYRALADGAMGVVAPIAALAGVVPVGVGLALGERPRPAQLAGVLVCVAGVVLVSGAQLRRRPAAPAPAAAPDPPAAPAPAAPAEDPPGPVTPARSVGLALVAAAGFGTVAVLIARGARTSPLTTLLSMRASVVGLLVVGALVRGRRPVLARADLPVLAALGAADVLANAAYAVASRHGLLSVVAVLASLYPAVTVVLARWVHHESSGRWQLAGIATTLAGVVLIGAGGGTG